MKPIYLLVGIPGSGKSYVCEKLKDKFTYLRHDDYMKNLEGYLRDTAQVVSEGKSALIETPFSMSQIIEPLARKGLEVIPVFIIEDEKVVSKRYLARDGKPIPKGHITRQATYFDRALDGGHFYGTSDEVLKHLQDLKL